MVTWRKLIAVFLIPSFLLGTNPSDDNRAKTLAPYFEALATDDLTKASMARDALLQVLRKSDLEYVCKAARDKRARVRAGALGCFKPFRFHSIAEPPDVVSLLLERMQDSDSVVREAAIGTSSWFAGQDKRLLKQLIVLLADHECSNWDKKGDDSPVSRHAAHALGGLGRKARPVYRDLLKLASAGNGLTKEQAIDALAKIAGYDKEYQPLLLTFLLKELQRSKPGQTQAVLARSFHYAGPAAAEALPTLRKTFKCIGVKDSKTRMIIQGGVLISMSGIGPAAKVALPDVIPILEDPKAHLDLQALTIHFVICLKNEGRPAIPALRTLAKAKGRQGEGAGFITSEAKSALEHLGVKSE